MQRNALPLFCIAAATLLSGCITRTVEMRPVAPVVESYSAPVTARSATAASSAPHSAVLSSGASGVSRQDSSNSSDGANGPATPPGVQVEAVVPGVYSGRSLSFERDEAAK